MSSINPLGGPGSVVRPQLRTPIDRPSASTPASRADQLQLSGIQAKSTDIRADKVAQVRAQIEAGTYETDEKIDAAIGKLLDEIA